MRELRREYTLFIDESGQFGEDALASERAHEQPSSQICGILLPGVYEKKKRGSDLPPALLSLFPKGGEMHATDISHADRAKLLEKVMKSAKRSEWRLVRLVNNSGIGEGELIQTYTRMVAELIVCLYQALCEERPREQAVIHLTYAQVLLGKRVNGREYYFARNEVTSALRYQGTPIMIPINEYKEAIVRELEVDLGFGLGLSTDETKLILGTINEESARIHPALQLSDLISNVSYKRGRALRHYPHLRSELFDFMEPYDFELHPLKPQHQAEELANHHALGQAITLVLNNLNHRNLSEQARKRLEETLNELIEDLAEEHSAEQRSDLSAILDAIEDIVERKRDASRAEALIKAVNSLVLPSLERSLIEIHGEADLGWFRHRSMNLALANANHSGDLLLANRRRFSLQEIRSTVNDRWEEIPQVMEAQLNIAISLGEELEFEEGVKIAEEVYGFYQDLSSMLGAFRGESLLAPSLKMRGQAKALEVTLQLERYLCAERLVNGEPVDDLILRGREMGIVTLEHHHAREDLMRAHQQLSHLEALGERYDLAWSQLYKGLDGDPPLDELAEVSRKREACLMALDDLNDEELAFPLFHTLRLCCLEIENDPSESLTEIARSLIKLVKDRAGIWLSGTVDDYPTHAILRAWIRLNAHLDDDAASIGALRVLDHLVDQTPKALSLNLLALCTRLELAVTLAQSERSDTKRRVKILIEGDQGDLVSRRIKKLLKQVENSIGESSKLFAWLKRLELLSKQWATHQYRADDSTELFAFTMSYIG